MSKIMDELDERTLPLKAENKPPRSWLSRLMSIELEFETYFIIIVGSTLGVVLSILYFRLFPRG